LNGALASPGRQRFIQEVPGRSLVERAAGDEDSPGFSWDSDERPGLPDGVPEMCQEAANSAMRAYRDGLTRQSIRLRLDQLFDMETAYIRGQRAVLNASLPAAEEFTRLLWGGQYLKNVRTSRVDEEVATLIYREAENEAQDMACLYFAGREFVSSNKAFSFFENMKDRLVLMVNSESATDSFSVENMGRDFVSEGKGDAGAEICQMFYEQTYYYYAVQFNNWQMIFHRAYPYPWEIYIENLNYTLVKVGESEEKPGYNKIIGWLEAYEAENNIKVSQKVGKSLRDAQAQEADSNEKAPGWRGR